MDWIAPGVVLAGKYALERKLGQGGMGAVWRAEHVQLRSPVAIKVIDHQIASSPDAIARFLREAQSAAALRSPHVVQILDFGADRGVPYIAMELLEGESLADRFTRIGRMPRAEIARVITQVARALAKAHEMGIVHRDIKPDNIFIVRNDEEDVAKVLDFGIAKSSLGVGVGSGSTTRTGAILGTPNYMSPEQAEGTKQVDHRTDLWALGVIVFEALLGRRPFDSDALGSLLLAICTRPIPIPSEWGYQHPGFDAWFARACAREVHDRFQTARDLATELRQICGVTDGRDAAASLHGPTVAALTPRPTTPYFQTQNPVLPTAGTYTASVGVGARRRPIAAWLAGIILLSAVAAGTITFLVRKERTDPINEPTASSPAAMPPKPAEPPVAPLVAPALEPLIVPTPEPSADPADTEALLLPVPTSKRPRAPVGARRPSSRVSAPTPAAPAPAPAPPPAPAPAAPEPKPASNKVNLGI